jgi:large conductance mechanosensitive channel
MPIRLEDASDFIEDAGEEVHKRAGKFWHGFSSFALQDNVLEVAVGLM